MRVWDAVLGAGYVDHDALKLAMTMLNQRMMGRTLHSFPVLVGPDCFVNVHQCSLG